MAKTIGEIDRNEIAAKYRELFDEVRDTEIDRRTLLSAFAGGGGLAVLNALFVQTIYMGYSLESGMKAIEELGDDSMEKWRIDKAPYKVDRDLPLTGPTSRPTIRNGLIETVIMIYRPRPMVTYQQTSRIGFPRKREGRRVQPKIQVMKRRNLLKYGIEAGVVTLLGVGIVESDLLSNTDTLPIRPPGAPAESDFLRRCIKCGRCIQTCPVDALGFTDIREGVLRSGTPKLVPEAAGCITWDRECLACIDACPVDALEPVATDENGIPTDEVIGRAQIDDTRCINCGNCYPICPVDAVYPEGREGRPTYSIDYEACIGCGRCIEICPVEDKAVELYPPDSEPEYPIEMDGKA